MVEPLRSQAVSLYVLEADSKDIGKGIARIDPYVMKKIGLSDGDVVYVEGRRRTVARVMQSKIEDFGLYVIRMDSALRKNANVKIGEKVFIEKTNAIPASVIKLSPYRYSAPIDNEVKKYIKRRLIGRVVLRDDIVHIKFPAIPEHLPFLVVYTKPKGPVVINEETEVSVFEKHTKIPLVTFEDIGGLGNAIQRVRELVELPLKHPEIFKRLGIEPPKGILLYGPPGCGKTLLAKAIANEINAYFIPVNGPEIMSKYYGESEQKLREIFEHAKKNAPAVIFIDEIDSIAPKREEVVGEVEKRVVAQLLTLMDGLETRGDVVVIAATNRINAVDPALRRPGRFDVEIEVPLPDKSGRLEILQIHTRNTPLADDVDLVKLAEITYGFTGADLAALVKEAAFNALRRVLPEAGLNDENFSPKVFENIEVKMIDFLNAMKGIVPSGLREIYVEIPEVKWSDIGGLDEIKQELKEIIEWPLKNPMVFKRMGIQPPRGVLFIGPPGCGKTLLAKAVANESGANLIAVRGPEILSKWVGESERAIREIFRKARMYAPAIVFFDEIESIAPARGIGYDSHVTERMVSQLLTEMSGIQRLENVVIVGATNRPDLVEPALLRPGRFDKIIYVPPPDYKARLEILRIHTRFTPLAEDVDLHEISRRTEGYSGADLEALVREAALVALREDFDADQIYMKHFEKALQTVKPSITQETVRFYTEWYNRAKQRITSETKKPVVQL